MKNTMLALYPKPESFIGKEFDGYRIDSVLGSGGMGIVFKATQLELSRQVALKFITPSLTQDENFWNQFKVEAQALAKIHHPNIVVIYNFRPSDHGFYIAMEYVKGTPFSEYIKKRGKVAWPECVVLIKQILSALDASHKTGIVHRDIKPSNLIVNDQNFVKITDFGLAKIHDAGIKTDDSTVSLDTVGTLFYMPPEEIRGLSKVDHRGDIYSVGMTMYEAIAGRLPFDKNASGYDVQKSIVEQPFSHINKYVPSLPKPLGRVIMKAIEKEPHKRFQSTGEMLTALDRCTSKAVSERKSTPFILSPIVQAQAEKTKNLPTYVPVLGAAFLVLIILFPLASLFNFSSKPRTLAEQLQENGISLSIEKPKPLIPPKQERAIPVSDSSSATSQDDRPVLAQGQQTDKRVNNLPTQALASTQASVQIQKPPLFLVDTGSIRITSEPPEAEVILNGTPIGVTPLFMDVVPAGTIEIQIHKKNFITKVINTEIQPLEISVIEEKLKPIQGILRIEVNPPSHVYLNGRRITTAPTASLQRPVAAASHKVSISNKEIGEWIQTISVQKNDTASIAVDFSKKITIPVTAFNESDQGMHAEIYVDNESTGVYTPAQLTLPPGKHLISVQSEGHELVEKPASQNYDTNLDEPLRFTLKKKP